MAKVGAQRAAELTGKSKSTVQRAMNAGKLSFEVDGNGRRLVDVSELDRVFGLQPQGNNTSSSASSDMGDSGMSAMELELEKARHAIEIERLKMEVRMVGDQLDIALRQIEDLKVQRDLWQKQATQILITSQYSQKQSEERIAEMREREEARQRAVDSKRMQQGAVNHAPNNQASRQATPAQQAARPQGAVQQQAPVREAQAAQVQPAQNAQTPVFRTVQPGNQNRPVAAPATQQKASLFASLFGNKKTRNA